MFDIDFEIDVAIVDGHVLVRVGVLVRVHVNENKDENAIRYANADVLESELELDGSLS